MNATSFQPFKMTYKRVKGSQNDQLRSQNDHLRYLAWGVSCMMEERDFKAVVLLVCSQDSIARQNDCTFEALKQEHPSPHPDNSIPVFLGDPANTSVSEKEIVHAIRSCPNSSAAGLDGLKPHHLKDTMSLITRGGA